MSHSKPPPLVSRVKERKIVKHAAVPKKIKEIRFGVFGEEDIRKLSHLPIVHPELYQMPAREYVPFGVLDARLGTSSKGKQCETCGLPLKDCVGHYGYIDLELPVFHVGYMKDTIELLQRVCKSCSSILLSNVERKNYLARLRNPDIEYLDREKVAKEALEKCKKVTVCPHCGELNGPVKKISAVKIGHEQFRQTKNKDMVADAVDGFQEQFRDAIDANPDLEHYIGKAVDDLNPLRTYDLFRKISNEDVELMNMDHKFTRPENLLVTQLLVPPVSIRPSIPSEIGTNEDDLTIYLAKIVHHNDLLKQGIMKGQGMEGIMETWDYIQLLVAFYINSELPGFPPSALSTGKPTRSLTQRLKGKHGRFRGNLSGKRVDFSGRTVISPDPNLRIDEVAVPILIAKVLTYPERVNIYNRERLQSAILNGPDVYPGANFVQLSSNDGNLPEASLGPVQEDKRFLKFANRKQIARNLKVGDIVERHLLDGDYVLFNRQPSLHRMSIMCHRVRVLPYRTLRFNECVCAPYNADFDGDEMNLHVPQTEEARAEASTLMGVLNNLITPRNGEPLVSCTQDFLTGAYLMTRKSQFFDRSEFCMLCSYMDINEAKIDLPPPTIVKPMEMWTGKQLFSLLIKPNRQTEVFVNLEAKNRSYSRNEHFCLSDGFVCFQNSYLISGTLDKKLLGGESKYSLFYILIKNYGAEYAAECMGRVARVTSRWLMNRGFSIGIDDVQPSDTLTSLKQKLLEEADEECGEIINQYKTGKLEPQPGCDAEQTLESILNGKLSQLRNDAGKICVGELHWTNAPLTMALCGSKGSQINISQMVALVGQQAVGGSRIANGFMNRTLPHFRMFSRDPDAKGFVANSFYTGLTPIEFFFHTMGGREGLVDTAVKTAETGYMQRRLMKALEDLSTQYDYTVRNSEGNVLQFTYGDDGLDPHLMEAEDGRPVNLKLSLMHIRNTIPSRNERTLTLDQIRKITHDTMKGWEDKEVLQNVFLPELFRKEVNDFIESVCAELEDIGLTIQENLEAPSTMKDIDEEEHVAGWEAVLAKWHYNRLTRTQLESFLKFCKDKFVETVADPGQAVGAIAGQSIGEPGTQMTLKTFHFAGVASMNVTLGVPRIVEIINATRNISTPIITAELNDNNDERIARIIKGRIEKTTLLQVARYIREVYDVGVCYIEIQLDSKIITALQLDIDNNTVLQSIINTPKLGIKNTLIKVVDGNIRVFPPKNKRDELFHSMQVLKRKIPNVIVCGIPTVNRVVINKNKDKRHYLLSEGTNIMAVMGVPGVKSTHVTSNNVLELEETLGIEAARKVIMDEIHYTMSSYGMTIDGRHLRLLADVMSSKGEILGIQRFGIRKMRDSVLMLASFEMTTDHLFDAATHSRKDSIEGVSECIIMGMPIGLGTGLFKLLHDVGRSKSKRTVEERLNTTRASMSITGGLPLFSRPELMDGHAQSNGFSHRLTYGGT